MKKNIFYKSINFKIFIYILLFTALAAGVMLRSVEVFNKNFLFGFDQGRDYLAVKQLVVDHKPTLIGSEIGAGFAGIKGIFHGPFHYYFLAIPFVIFDGDPYGGLLLMYLFGISSIFVGYLLGKKIFGNMGGLFVATFLSLSPPLISQSRFIWNSHPSTFFILLSFYFLYRFIIEKKKTSLFLAGFFAAFVYNFELAIAVPLTIAFVILVVLITKFKNIGNYAIIFVSFFVAFSPAVFFEIRHNFQGIRGITAYIFHNSEISLMQDFFQILLHQHLKVFINNFSYAFPPNTLISPLVLVGIVIVPVLFFIKKEKEQNIKTFMYFLLILPLVNFVVFGFLRNYIYDYYLIDLSIAYIFLFCYLVIRCFQESSKFFIGFATFISLFFLLSGIYAHTKNAVDDYQDYGGTHKIKGKIDALDFIYRDAKGKKFSLFVFSPPIYTYPYDYILWWHGQKKYGYIPHNEKKGVFYLLIEPDPHKPWTHEGWLETVIKTGSIIKTVELPSGFIVQKRME